MSRTELFDILIRGGLVCDGTGSPAFGADIGVVQDRISAVGDLSRAAARCVIEACGLVVAPGFIDVHAHSDFSILADPRAQAKISQGITTEINGNCGLSAAPLLAEAWKRREADLREYGINEQWEDLPGYFRLLETRGMAVNGATLVGHGNIRGSIIGYANRTASKAETDAMIRLLDHALHEGALGLSTGLIYPPGIFTPADELIELAGMVRRSRGIYATHMRSEGSGLAEAVEETIGIGKRSGVHVHISHIKTAGEENWGKAASVIGMMDVYRHEGGALTCDCYPYTASSTDLDALLPAWVFENGNEQEISRLGNRETRERIRREMHPQTSRPGFWDAAVIASVASEGNAWIEGLNVAGLAAAWKIDPFDAFVRLLLEERLRVGAIFHSMSEENKRKFLSLPYCMLGTDSTARSFDGITRRGRPHPRGFGTFPRLISRHVRTEKLFSLEEAVRKATRLPAETFGIRDRGCVCAGAYADLVLFDPEQIQDLATFENPFTPSDGIRWVFVNGRPVIEDGSFTGLLPGRILRKR